MKYLKALGYVVIMLTPLFIVILSVWWAVAYLIVSMVLVYFELKYLWFSDAFFTVWAALKKGKL